MNTTTTNPTNDDPTCPGPDCPHCTPPRDRDTVDDLHAFEMALAGVPLWSIALQRRGQPVGFTYRRTVRRRRPWLARSLPGAWCACGRRIEYPLQTCPACVGEEQIRKAIERAKRVAG